MDTTEEKIVDPKLIETVKRQVMEAKAILEETGDEIPIEAVQELKEHCKLFKYFPELDDFITNSGIEELIGELLNGGKSFAVMH
jgi:hypothetical protein